MYERKIWTGEEDGALLKLISEFESKKWSQIAKTMEVDYNIPGRTGKQCRERWHNTLNPAIKGENWSAEDSMKLFQYHTLYGNRWAKIATLFGNRSDNSVKNHFYSTLRKAHRIINKFIKEHKKKFSQRPLKDNVLSKIISLSEETENSDQPQQLIVKAKSLLVNLVEISQCNSEEFDMKFMESVIAGLIDINKGFKLKKINKRKRRQTAQQGTIQEESGSVSQQNAEKEPTELSVPSPSQENQRKGFKLYDSKAQGNSGCGFSLNPVQPALGGMFMVYNNQCQYVMCYQPGYTQQDYPPLMLYNQMWPHSF